MHNRLLNAHYTCPTAASAGGYDENIAYDVMGNISALQRNALIANTPTLIDNLTYNYYNGNKSNQLTSVPDAVTTAYPVGQAPGTASYTYDANGNQLTDSQKGTTISYNYLNLPQSITQTGNASTLTFVYAADGRKLRKLYSTTAARD